MQFDARELCSLDLNLYSCISPDIATERVVLTNKSVIHIADHHPDAYNEILGELKDTIVSPDYIIKDDRHPDTGLIVKELPTIGTNKRHSFIVLKVCTNTKNGELANSIISGWKISEKRLHSYLRNKHILYKND